MPRTTTILATAVATLSLGFVAAFPANATPTPPPLEPKSQGPGDPGFSSPPSHEPSKGKSYTWDVSKSGWDEVNRAVKADSTAHTNRSGQIDYTWVKDKFSGKDNVNQLYEFTAGFWYRRQDWDQFTNITSSDKKAVIAWSKKHSGPNPKKLEDGSVLAGRAVAALAASGDGNKVSPLKPKGCTGTTTLAFDKPEGLYWLYYNSCDAANLHDVVEGGGVVLGFVSAVSGVITEGLAFLPTAVEAMFFWLTAKAMDRARDESDLDAIIIRVSTNYKKSKAGHYYAPLKIYPQ